MQQKLYSELVGWYRLFTPPKEYVAEAACYEAALVRGGTSTTIPNPTTLLELGSGAGHIASFLKQRFTCTLTDLSPDMLALSRELNPDCEHVVGDMRTVRLDREFDVVFVHDAVGYMLSEDDLRAAVSTAYLHTRRGGAALFAPDAFKDRFVEGGEHHEAADGDRAIQCVAWTWDPDENDSTYVVDYAFLLREHGEVTAVHDRHVEGLFTVAAWREILEDVGFVVELIPRPLDDDGAFDEVFLCRRP